ncbi:ATP-dependent DNA ligase [Metapseudomonas otitidis]|uniref:ATP-dependent DNA ligase n=1 Tax=Metapseudomonas otitidis TaxID=319939 RepID=UPI0008ECAE04|nr:ATP-dependent DNA ligase [Pseudomonas otitidis]SFA53760.1 DNA ligase-1 [Pseudomonas otitidis]
MKAFADLYMRLDASTSSNAKLAALEDYFRQASAEDAAWAVYFLSGGKPRQLVPVRQLKASTLAVTGLPEWLFEESYQSVGDLAETIALLLPPAASDSQEGLAQWLEEHLLPLRGLPPAELTERLSRLWARLDRDGLLVFNKLITGAFRVGVSRLLVTRALASLSGLDPKRIAQRMVGYTDISRVPSADGYRRLIAAESPDEHRERGGQPYPFFLAHPLQLEPEAFDERLGPPSDWLAEWKWDGIRAQLVRRDGQLWIWSRGEELVTERFPELHALCRQLPDGCVIDGELLVWKDGRAQPFALLQQRIGRKRLTRQVLEDAPVRVLAYDLLEWQGEDWRSRPQQARRAQLEQLLAGLDTPLLGLSPEVTGATWEALAAERQRAREQGVEGLMLKARDARYGVGRTREDGTWWKWKLDPYSVDAVLIYAQRGHGRRASLYTDFTFAVWAEGEGDAPRSLVPFAKAYSGLTDEEMRQVDAIIRRTTVEKFGPVRSVTPSLVFELGFEGIARSRRHKSGVAVRFPRMLRWRRDKPVEDADTLASLHALLGAAPAEDDA